jgi:hypothetical protein
MRFSIGQRVKIKTLRHNTYGTVTAHYPERREYKYGVRLDDEQGAWAYKESELTEES